ncbi:MAG: hypothetical protein ACJ8C4_06360 [Gemmataceae bacterium]
MSIVEVPSPGHRSHSVLWAAFLLGPVAWAIQLQSLYALSDAACATGVRLPLHIVAGCCLLAGIVGTLLSWRNGRVVAGTPDESDVGGVARVKLFSTLGMLTGGLFSLVMAAEWIAVLMLFPCPL